jgi:hypothetical protein
MQNLKNLLIAGVIALSLITSCTFTTSYSDRESDKNDAKKVCDKFFDALKRNDYKAVYPLFSDRFFRVTPKDTLNGILNMSKTELGNVITTGITDWETKVTRGTTMAGDYSLVYSVHREKYDSKEQFRLEQEIDGGIRIVYYHIASDGFK